MVNSVDPDETAHVDPDETAHDLDLNCLQKYLSWSTGLKGLKVNVHFS